ncbi:hypothetical protein NW739_02810 [Mycoplasmopsis felis]|uniref:hypothetical protein n=1 Tax=Mycoplasmopsis felis TaxID=33923 RepID=UPI0021AF3851|nr:hypothetical protein [Mycoplasmopsis felis]MCU9939302.1 hypothetical protein [Mycoplasmopsis felis]MCU9939695.1 hypothetical protein [Mycoplasmopsis felis]UWV79285.1 hypothetical protein NW072_04460 [Mycoplasmopsis felis]
MIEKFKKVLIPDGAKISKRKNAWYVQVVVKREYIKVKNTIKKLRLQLVKKFQWVMMKHICFRI